MQQLSRFAKYAWFVLAYTILVILWGAYVRATGSGAGCGSHWPSCNGEIIPRPEQIETIIELTHRITSSFLGVLIIIMLVWAFRIYPKGHAVRRGSVYSLIFVITEGAIGAGLVLLELVADNSSVARAVSGALHLINTFILVAWLLLTAWWASDKRPYSLQNQGLLLPLLMLGAFLILLISSSGAITALGDTLFPAESLAEGIGQDFDDSAHFLVRLRIWHPVVALLSSYYLYWLNKFIRQQRSTPLIQQLTLGLNAILLTQLLAGFVNVILLAPVWMQIVHLLLADLVWIFFVLVGATSLAAKETAVSPIAAIPQTGD
ncbi:MAG: COX15/CtaA family protein [Chloroflexota bacterium]